MIPIHQEKTTNYCIGNTRQSGNYMYQEPPAVFSGKCKCACLTPAPSSPPQSKEGAKRNENKDSEFTLHPNSVSEVHVQTLTLHLPCQVMHPGVLLFSTVPQPAAVPAGRVHVPQKQLSCKEILGKDWKPVVREPGKVMKGGPWLKATINDEKMRSVKRSPATGSGVSSWVGYPIVFSLTMRQQNRWKRTLANVYTLKDAPFGVPLQFASALVPALPASFCFALLASVPSGILPVCLLSNLAFRGCARLPFISPCYPNNFKLDFQVDNQPRAAYIGRTALVPIHQCPSQQSVQDTPNPDNLENFSFRGGGGG